MMPYRCKAIAFVALASTLIAPLWSKPKSAEKAPRRTIAHSVVSPNYERKKGPDGEWKRETFALGIGKMIDASGSDPSLESLSIEEMAEILSNALAKQNFWPESDPENTDLLIVVNWGKTLPHNDSLQGLSIEGIQNAVNALNEISGDLSTQGPGLSGLQSAESDAALSQLESALLLQDLAERYRREANDTNAKLLGFAPALYDEYRDAPVGGPQRILLDDLVSEVELQRYFVILQAYDYKKLVENKEKEILWITRFSIRAKNRRFDEEFSNMANAARTFFGTRSGQLKRNLLPGKGELGELEVVDLIDDEEEETSD